MDRVKIYSVDKNYWELGRWKCKDSPTGGHHSREIATEGRYGLFVCKFCGYVQKRPLDYFLTMKNIGKRSDPMGVKE